MKAAVYRQYGPPEVVQVEELPEPVPGEREVLIKVHASTVSSGDWRARSLEMPPGFSIFARPAFGLFGPRKVVLGTELAGTIARVGGGVTKFKPGDAVFAFPGFQMGCHAEYRVVREDGPVLPMPAGMSFEEAAAISFGGSTALHFLRDRARLSAGEELLVIGASGAVGSAAVQLAKHFGAVVTGVTSTANLDRVRALGADRVIDYTETDPLREGAEYDVVMDTVGSASLETYMPALREGGRLILCATGLRQVLGAGWASRRSKRKIFAGPASEDVALLRGLKELVEAGRYRPLIDRRFPLARIAEAHAYVATGRKRGSVVVTMDGASAGE